MRGVLRKRTSQDKYFKYQNFSTHFRLSLFLECFGVIWRKSVKSIYPINSLKVVVILSKLNARFLLIKVQTTCATPGDYLAYWNRKPMASMTMVQDFLGKVTHTADTFFIIVIIIIFFYLDRSVEHWEGWHNNEQSFLRQRKKVATKMERPQNVLRSRTTNRQTAFNITIRGDF